MDIKSLLRREAQLNVIAYVIIIALLVCVGLLLFVLFTGTAATTLTPLTDATVRTLIVGLLLATILYLVDQHRRLRTKLVEAHEQLAESGKLLQAAYDRLAFAHHASETITSLAEADGLSQVLTESMEHFGADAAAVVGEDVTFTARTGVDEGAARDRVLAVALEAVRVGKPLSVSPPGERGAAIAVPLRVAGRLQAVACLWRRQGAFGEDQLDGLGLLGRIIELSMENRLLLDETNAQLDGVIEALDSLVEDIRPDYTRHAASVGDLAALIGRELGRSSTQQRELRVAGLLHDVGMLRIGKVGSPQQPLSTSDLAKIRCHPAKGADLARMANFGASVQGAIRSHHEHVDGTGYPSGIAGTAIPLSARILAVTEAYDSMTRKSYNGRAVDPETAIRELRAYSGTRYDGRVVEALIAVLRTDEGVQAATVEALLADLDATNIAATERSAYVEPPPTLTGAPVMPLGSSEPPAESLL